jgi:hypothetical protein
MYVFFYIGKAKIYFVLRIKYLNNIYLNDNEEFYQNSMLGFWMDFTLRVHAPSSSTPLSRRLAPLSASRF